MTFPAAIFRWCLLIVAIAAPAAVTLPARAGDEVDYSAPYVTVENGELVTRYPAKEHDASKVGKKTAPPTGDEPMRPSLVVSIMLLAAFGIAVLVVAWRRVFARRA